MLVAIAYATVGLMVGFVLKKYLSDGVEKDLKEANYLLRTQVNTLLLNGMPYDCSEGQLQLARVVVKSVKETPIAKGHICGDTDGDHESFYGHYDGEEVECDFIDHGAGATPRFALNPSKVGAPAPGA